MGNSVPKYDSIFDGTTVYTCAGIYKQLPLFLNVQTGYYASISEIQFSIISVCHLMKQIQIRHYLHTLTLYRNKSSRAPWTRMKVFTTPRIH
jgi:hypothetical protein